MLAAFVIVARLLGDSIAATHGVGAAAAAGLSLLLALVASPDLDDEAVASLGGEAWDMAIRTREDVRS